ncbi:hypothetical protein JM654_17645 [Microbacterium oxydans]|nr:hypothetical protein [Microbacterium oxydans]
MPTFNDPTADAEEARQALRGLAHATIRIDDPDKLYGIVGELLGAARARSNSRSSNSAGPASPIKAVPPTTTATATSVLLTPGPLPTHSGRPLVTLAPPRARSIRHPGIWVASPGVPRTGNG